MRKMDRLFCFLFLLFLLLLTLNQQQHIMKWWVKEKRKEKRIGFLDGNRIESGLKGRRESPKMERIEGNY